VSRIIAVIVATYCIALSSARAEFGYLDVQGGVTELNDISAFFQSSASHSDLGMDLGATLMANLGRGTSPIQFQIGMSDRFASASAGSDSLLLNVIYPVARIQIRRLFISAGISPFIWQSGPGTGGNTQRAVGSWAYFGQAGILDPLTPLFSLGLDVTAQSIATGGTSGPNPIFSADVILRFYFEMPGPRSSAPTDWSGERYPHGSMR
jgi:hypothetical protein